MTSFQCFGVPAHVSSKAGTPVSEALNCLAAGFLEILNRDERGDETEEPRPRADGGEEFWEEPRARPDGGGEPRARSRAVRIPRPKVRSAFHTSASSCNDIVHCEQCATQLEVLKGSGC